jgi:hypothetical protein
MGQKSCRVCLGRHYIDWPIRNGPVEILLSQAGRVPGLAFANIGL